MHYYPFNEIYQLHATAHVSYACVHNNVFGSFSNLPFPSLRRFSFNFECVSSFTAQYSSRVSTRHDSIEHKSEQN